MDPKVKTANEALVNLSAQEQSTTKAAKPERRVKRRTIDVSATDHRRLPLRGKPRDKSYKPYYVGKDRRQYRRSREDPVWCQVDLDTLLKRMKSQDEADGGGQNKEGTEELPVHKILFHTSLDEVFPLYYRLPLRLSSCVLCARRCVVSGEEGADMAEVESDDDVIIGRTTNVMDRALEESRRPPAHQRREINADEGLERAPCRGRPRDKSYKPYYRRADRRQVKSSKLAAEKAKQKYLRELREDEKAEERARKACIKIDSEGNPIVKPQRRGGRKKRTAKK